MFSEQITALFKAMNLADDEQLVLYRKPDGTTAYQVQKKHAVLQSAEPAEAAYCGHQLTRMIGGIVCCLPCDDTYSQCSQCKLWFPEYDPKSIGEKPEQCDHCGHDKLFPGESGYRCSQCGHNAPAQNRAKCLDGIDADGEMSHVSGKLALEPSCIFCEYGGSEETSENSHATRGIALT